MMSRELRRGPIARLVTAAALLALISFMLPSMQGAAHADVTAGTWMGPTTGFEGQVWSGTLGTFTDANCGTPADYVAYVDWGDGHTSLADVSGLCNYTVQDTHVFQEEGPYVINVSVKSDLDGTVAHLSATDQISDAPLTQASAAPMSFAEGTQQNAVNIGVFTDADNYIDPTTSAAICDAAASNFSVSIDWGDGTQTDTATGSVIAAGSPFCSFTVAGSHKYKEEGSYTVNATVTDQGGSSTIVTTTATVIDNNLSTIGGSNFSGPNMFEGKPITLQYLGTFHDADTGCQAADYTPVISWGDGTAADGVTGRVVPSSVSFVPCTFDVLGTHTYLEEGTYNTCVVVADHPFPVAPVPPPGNPCSTAVNGTTFITGTATIADAPLQTLDKANLSTPCSPGSSTSCPLIEGTNYNSGLDPNGTSGLYLGTIHDFNLSPSPSPGFGCFDGSDFTVSISWGDGSAASTGVAAPAVANPQSNIAGQPGFCNFDIFGSHQYGEEASHGYQVTVTVTDSGGQFTTILDNAVVQDAPLNLNDEPASTLDVGDPATAGPCYSDWPPSTNTGGPVELVEGTQFQCTLGTFTDTNTGCATESNPVSNPAETIPQHYSATVDWGDGSGLDTTSGGSPNVQIVPSLNGNPCDFDVVGTHTYQEDTMPPNGQPYHLTVTISDTPSTQVVISELALVHAHGTVTDAALTTANPGGTPPAPTETEGSHFKVYLGTFNDAAGTLTAPTACDIYDYAVTIDWGDGGLALGDSTASEHAVNTQTTVTAANGGIVADPASGSGPNPGLCNFDILGSYDYLEQSNATFPVTITVYDIAGATTTWGDTMTVNDAAITNAPTVTAGANNFKPVEGQPIQSTFAHQPVGLYQYLGTFTDADPLCHASDYYLNVDWGDGGVGGLPSPDTVDDGPTSSLSQSVMSISLTSAGSGYTSPPNVTIDSPGSGITAKAIAKIAGGAVTAIVISDPGSGYTAPPTAPPNVTIDAPGVGTTATATATIAPTLAAVGPSFAHTTVGCSFDLYGAHTYPDEASAPPYTVTVNIIDAIDGPGAGATPPLNATTSWSETATAKDAALSVVPQTNHQLVNVNLVEGTPPPGEFYLGTIHDANLAYCDVRDFSTSPGSVTIAWGDGTSDTLPGSSNVDIQLEPTGATPLGIEGPCNFDVFGTHTYSEESEPGVPYQITSTVSDVGGSMTVLNSTATVADAPLNQTPLVAPGNALGSCDLLTTNAAQGDQCTGVLASFTDNVYDNGGNLACDNEANPEAAAGAGESLSSHYLISINWGDGSPADTKTGVVSEPGAVNSCAFNVTGTHVFTQPGTFHVATTITDEGHGPPADGASITLPDTATVNVPASSAPTGGVGSTAVTQFSYPAGAVNPLYVINLAMTGYKNKVGGSVAPATGSPPPWLLGHVNFLDRYQSLKIPPSPLASCANLYQPTYQCKLIPLAFVCSSTIDTYSPLGAGKGATIWIEYKYTPKGSSLQTRYARFDLLDPDPSLADNYRVTMSSMSNAAVSATSIPTATLNGHVVVNC